MDPADNARLILEPFIGHQAEVWDYTVSHSVLRIKLEQDESNECAIIVFKACRNISFEPYWQSFNPNISVLESSDRISIEDSDKLSIQTLNIYVQGQFTSYADIPGSWMER